MSKPEFEFFDVSEAPWQRVEGPVDGLYERILARADDRVATRLLRFDEGTDTSANGVQVHDFWEEVYILEGAITDLSLGTTFSAGMFACRPPGMWHGPWRSDGGCTTFEVRYHGSP